MNIENKNEYIDLGFLCYATESSHWTGDLSDEYNCVEIIFSFNIEDVGCGVTGDYFITTRDIAAMATGFSRIRYGTAQEFTLSGRYPHVNAGEKPFFTVNVCREGDLIRFTFTIYDGVSDDITVTERMSPARFEEIAEEFRKTAKLYPVRGKQNGQDGV